MPRCLDVPRPSWQHFPYQHSLLARFPSLGLGLGALAPHEGRIAWEDKRLKSKGAPLVVRGPRGRSGTAAFSKVTTKHHPAHYPMQPPEEALVQQPGRRNRHSWGGWPKGGGSKANRRRRSWPGGLDQAAGECCTHIQCSITLLCRDFHSPSPEVYTTGPPLPRNQEHHA